MTVPQVLPHFLHLTRQCINRLSKTLALLAKSLPGIRRKSIPVHKFSFDIKLSYFRQKNIQDTMKRQLNILTIATLALLVYALPSCKKYTCECTAYDVNNPEPSGHSNYTVKKKDRAKNCTDKSTQPDNNGFYTTCVIK